MSKMSSLFPLVSVFLLFHFVHSLNFAKGPITPECIACICKVESNCTDSPCEDGKGCGYFKLTKTDWSLCGKPLGSWETCAHSIGCSSSCMQVYVALYSFWCDGHSCEHASRLINGGTEQCKKPGTVPYWHKVKNCLQQK